MGATPTPSGATELRAALVIVAVIKWAVVALTLGAAVAQLLLAALGVVSLASALNLALPLVVVGAVLVLPFLLLSVWLKGKRG